MPVDRVSLAPTNMMADRPVFLLLPEQMAQLALRLLEMEQHHANRLAHILPAREAAGKVR